MECHKCQTHQNSRDVSRRDKDIQNMDIETLKYPIGKMPEGTEFTQEQIQHFILRIEQQPEDLREVLMEVNAANEHYSYRPGGWSIRQITHHIADSHINAYVRTKLALTEQVPVIKPYDENEWVLLEDTKKADLSVSVELLRLITLRWVLILRSLSAEQLEMKYHHPASKKDISLKQMLCMYDWHGHHHIAHIKQALKVQAL